MVQNPRPPPKSNLRGGNTGSDDKGIHAEFLSMEAYYLKYEYRDKDMAWGISMILLCILLITACLCLNITVFKFYQKKARDDVVSLIYSLLSFADVTVAVGASITAVCLVQYLALDMEEKEKDFVYPSVQYISYISFFISSIAVRVSVALNALLSIVRTIMIRDPFSQPSKVGICIAVGVMAFLWTFLTAGEIYTVNFTGIEEHWTRYTNSTASKPQEEDDKNRKQYLYLWYFIFTSATGYNFIMESLGDKLPWSANLYKVGGFVSDVEDEKNKIVKDICERTSLYGTFCVAFVVPCMVSIVCLVMQTSYLRKPSVAGSNNKNRKVTNTIMMLTLVFVFCNVLNIIVISIAMFHKTWFMEEGTTLMGGFVTNDEDIIGFYRSMFAVIQLLPLINSTLSPVVLIWQGSALKAFIRDIYGNRRIQVYPSCRTRTKTSLC
ncbi:hypothetical protein ACHWQZ_G018320 [Mnemiopsis leidyi]